MVFFVGVNTHRLMRWFVLDGVCLLSLFVVMVVVRSAVVILGGMRLF